MHLKRGRVIEGRELLNQTAIHQIEKKSCPQSSDPVSEEKVAMRASS